MGATIKSYAKIARIVGCSRSNVRYHLGEGVKEKCTTLNNKNKKNRQKKCPFIRKLEEYSIIKVYSDGSKYGKNKDSSNRRIYKKIQGYHITMTTSGRVYEKLSFTKEDIINKCGENPKCYLTGVDIDLYNPSTYEFDHKIPRSKGGQNTLDNLGVCTKVANRAKQTMTPDEFISLCKLTLEHNGYDIIPKKNQ